VTLYVNKSEHVRSRLPRDVVTLHLVDEAKAGQLQRFDLRDFFIRELALDGHQYLS